MPIIDIAGQGICYSGGGLGDTLLVFPDNIHSSRAYDKEIAHFSDRFHVLSFDYPGTGRSTREVRYQDEREVDLWNYFADFACHLLLALDIDSGLSRKKWTLEKGYNPHRGGRQWARRSGGTRASSSSRRFV